MTIDRRTLLLGGATLVALGAAQSEEANHPASAPRERVLGIGGFFFRSRDPKALAKWYEEYLGVDPLPADYNHAAWQQAAGPTAFAPFPSDTSYFGAPTQSWMINFRVRDLDAMVAQLRASGIAIVVEKTVYPNGRFARLHDPEGNPVELWEPAQGR
jgi:predicted enzyme related to lactoylglutathione lyase